MRKFSKMKSGFTMVELIFVIVIIGLIAAVAVPKFAGITDSAKTNSELSTMENLKSSLEWSKQKYVDIATPEWNGGTDSNNATYDIDQDGYEELYAGGRLTNLHLGDNATNEASMVATTRGTNYATANTSGSLFTQVSESGGKGMKVVAYQNIAQTNGDDVLVITGKSSDASSGVEYPSTTDAGASRDFAAKPDRNDFWVFNGKSTAIVVDMNGDGDTDTSTTPAGSEVYTVPPYGSILIDVTGTSATTYTNVVLDLDGDGTSGEAGETFINTNL